MKKIFFLIAVLFAVSISAQTVVSNGRVVIINSGGGTDDQELTLVGNTLTLEDGGTVDLSPYLDNTDDFVVSGSESGGTLTLTMDSGDTVEIDLSGLGGGSGGYTTLVNNLSALQGLTFGDVGAITASIDLVNTDVTIPSGVTLINGSAFGSLTSSGTGELLLEEGSFIDPALLNHQLNIDNTSEGLLTSSILIFNAGSWGITRTDDMTGSIIWSNTTGRDQAILNRERVEKCFNDVKLLGGNKVVISNVDMYWGPGHYDDIIEDTQSDQGFRDGVFDLPSGMTMEMDSETYIRAFPNYNYAFPIITCYQKSNSNIIGGHLIGDRDTHLYRNVLIVTAAATSSPFTITIRDDSGVGSASDVDSEITINNPGTATRQSTAEDIRDGILALHPTWNVTASQYLGTSNWAVYTDNNTPGRALEVEDAPEDTSGGGYSFGNNRHEASHAISLSGAKNIKIDGVDIKYPSGDLISVVGGTTGAQMTFDNNSENILIRGVTGDYGRRLGIAANSFENLTIEQCVINNSGRPYNSNRGTEPASGMWFEPFRTRSGDGTLIEYSIARNLTVNNNRIFDSESAAIGLYTTYDAKVTNNFTNGSISYDFGEQNTLAFNTIDLSKGDYPASVGISFDSRGDEGFAFTREIPTHNYIINNTIKGDTTLVSQDYTGMQLEGYKIIVTGNIIRNMGNSGISVGTLIDSQFNDNVILNDPELNGTEERGYIFNSATTQDVTVSGGFVEVGGSPIEINGNNSSPITSYGMDGTSLYFNTGVYKSTLDLASADQQTNYFRNIQDTYFKDVEFWQRVWVNGASSDNIRFDGCTFYADFYTNGTGQAQNNLYITNSLFKDDGTTNENIEIESRGISNNVVISGNIFEKASGAQAVRIFENGGQNNVFRIFNNTGLDNMTELLDFTGSASFIWGNTKEGVTSQTITLGSEGTANTVN